MKLHIGAPAINKAITSIQGRGAKLDADIHTAAVSVLKHAHEHGDTTLADKLVAAMPKGGRKLALVAYLLNFGAITMLDKTVDAERIANGGMFKKDSSKTFDEAGAVATSWTEFKKEADPATVFDAHAAVKTLLTRLNNAAKNGLSIEGKAEALAQVEAVKAALAGQ